MQVPAGHPEKPEGADGFKMLERMNGGHHEELALWGLEFLPLAQDSRVLEIGCGGGANIARLLQRAPQGHVVGVDYSPVSVEASSAYNAQAIAAGRCQVQLANVLALPFSDASFDVATAFETVYFWDREPAFAQVKRVLKPGGYFLICNEADGSNADQLDLVNQIPGMTMPTASELEETLTEAGFRIVESQRVPEKTRIAIVAQA